MKGKDYLLMLLFGGLLLWGITYFASIQPETETPEQVQQPESKLPKDALEFEASQIFGEPRETKSVREREVTVEGVGTFPFDPADIQTVRPDIFRPGHFSLFDVLHHLYQQELVDLTYSFDESMNTHVIGRLNGEEYWWYDAYYDGGWPESSVFRMDHYPYKDGMFLAFKPLSADRLGSIERIFREEVARREANDGNVIIPEVIIRGRNETLRFDQVEVTAHDLRDDMLQPGVITAIDVILSLGDAGKIRYDLKWYESIGTADIVKSYWVERINDDTAYDRCGFVYEAGSDVFRFFRGNHVHIPSDVRVLNSPEYVEYFWICI